MRAIPRRRRRLLLPLRRNWSRPTPLPSRYTNVFDWKSFVFSVFLDQNRSFFFASLSWGRSCLSLFPPLAIIQQSDDKSPTNVVIFCVGSMSAFSCVCFCAFRQKEKENIILKNFCSLFLSLLLLKKYRSSESAAAARTR